MTGREEGASKREGIIQKVNERSKCCREIRRMGARQEQLSSQLSSLFACVLALLSAGTNMLKLYNQVFGVLLLF